MVKSSVTKKRKGEKRTHVLYFSDNAMYLTLKQINLC